MTARDERCVKVKELEKVRDWARAQGRADYRWGPLPAREIVRRLDSLLSHSHECDGDMVHLAFVSLRRALHLADDANLGQILHAIEAHECGGGLREAGTPQLDDWLAVLSGVYEGANRYSTDDEEVLHLWRGGRSWDVRQSKLEVEAAAVRAEAAERVMRAFHTGGTVWDIVPFQTEQGRALSDALFNDVMLATEPHKAEAEARRRRGARTDRSTREE